jgi:sigma-B regulation protein RsbU (phosphoserine phosphatase)
MEPYRIRCSEIWGGVRSIDFDVRTGGLTASLYSQACGGDAGGDIYYFSVCGSDSLTRIALADVRGHGEQVSHMSSWIYDSLKQKMNTLDGGGVLGDLNTMIHQHGFEALTTASVVGYYTTESRLYFSYAGHPPALFCRRTEGKWGPLCLSSSGRSRNTILGALPSVHFDQEHTSLVPGDRFFLYTDGVIECPDLRGDEFGQQRLIALLNDADGESLVEIKTRVVEAIIQHIAPGPFNDDFTLLAAEVL